MNPAFEARYHELEADHWWFRSRREFVRGWLRRLGVLPQTRLVDLGCASGTLLRELQADGWTACGGVDFSPVAVERCRAAGLSGVVLGDAADPPCPAGSVDVLVASDVLEHLADDRLAARRWFEAARPGGYAVVCVPAFGWLWSDHDVVNHHYRRYTRTGLRRVLADAGWEIVQSGYWNAGLLPVVAAARFAQRGLRFVRRPFGAKPVGSRVGNPNAADAGQLRRTNGPLNRLVAAWMSLENRWLLAGGFFPAGVSTFVICRKPEATPRTVPVRERELAAVGG